MRLIILFSILWIGQVTAQDFPAVPKSIVTDYTKTLSSSELNALENKLLAFEDSTSTQIAIAIINTTGDYDIADYGDRLAQKWGVGSAKYNNGVLVLVALGDRAVTIRTGYGIEGSIPDAIAYRIIENEIKPAFRNGDYYGGLDKGTSAIISYSKGEYKADPSPKKGRRGGEGTVVLVIVIIIIFAIISKGGGGKGGKVVGGRGSSDLFWWMLMNSGGGRNDGGGFGGFGGGSSGGGFGGFGGGGFGGGGASGRW